MTTKKEASYWIKQLNLSPSLEGIYTRETYKSDEYIGEDALPDRFYGKRPYLNTFYLLLQNKDLFRFIKTNQEECWHYYTGTSPIVIETISEKGVRRSIKLGSDLSEFEYFQYVIPHDTWFAAYLQNEDGYALIGITASPSLDKSDVKKGKFRDLILKYPSQLELITRLCY
ncbi:MAG: cupin domain-containing protein [Hyphomicrobiales bacterium]